MLTAKDGITLTGPSMKSCTVDLFVYISAQSTMFSTVYFINVSKLTCILLFTTTPTFENCVDPDQLASEEANWSGSALFVIK